MLRPMQVVAVFCLCAGSASAGAIITNVDAGASGVQQFTVNNYHGYEFTLSTATTITTLGWYDVGADGLAGPTPVGLWDISQNLLASVTVASGTTDALVNGFRMHDLLSPVTIQPGTYVLAGGTQGSDAYLVSNSNFTFITFDSRITWVQERWASGNSPTFPINTTPVFALFGPNAAFDSEVPEPSSIGTVMLGIAGLVAWGRRNKTRAAR